LSADTQVIPIRPFDETSEPSDDSSSTIIIASVVSVIAVLIIVGGVLLYLKKKQSRKVADEIPAYSSNTEPAEDEKPNFKKAEKDSNLQINNTDENISELHFDKPV
jgi:flagellar basal body-associated protein FliL